MKTVLTKTEKLFGNRSKYTFENISLFLVIIALFGHFCALMTYSVNVPYADEWGGSFFYPGLQTKVLNWPFIVGFHNEHRIVWTRLQVWLAYYFFNLNFNALVAANYLIYALGAFFYLRWLSKTFNSAVAIVGLVLASTLAAGNHIIAFHGQIHYSILFFLAAIGFLLKGKSKILLSSLFAVSGIYSCGQGMIFGTFYLALCAVFFFIDRSNRKYLACSIGFVAIFLFLWFVGFPKYNNLSEGLVSLSVWTFFLNIITNGLGYSSYTVMPGLIVVGIFVVLTINLLCGLSKQILKVQLEQLALVAICCAFLTNLMIIALGRTQLGLSEAKSCRYSEVVLFLIPALITLLQIVIRKYAKHAHSFAISFSVFIVIAVPYFDEYSFAKVYLPEHIQRNRIVACIRHYFQNQQEPICPIPFNQNIKEHLDYAYKLEILFARVN